MAELSPLERELFALGPEIAWPPTPRVIAGSTWKRCTPAVR